ncbi:MAG: hypothetical protein DWQ02_07765 [Bacteroidetes bacterium]|nr:MAG: hypothetical protein DWQ02_07765 [Bacteroidota bacterium]
MESLNQHIREYKKQLDIGHIQKAYQGILHYLMDLRLHFQNEHPDFQVTSSINEGRMNMSYFAFSSGFLKKRKLKIVVIFNHNTISFEVWLCGFNKKVQKQYWEIIKVSDWGQYYIPDSIGGNFSILEHKITETPNFDDPDGLTKQLEKEILLFLLEIESYLKNF